MQYVANVKDELEAAVAEASTGAFDERLAAFQALAAQCDFVTAKVHEKHYTPSTIAMRSKLRSLLVADTKLANRHGPAVME